MLSSVTKVKWLDTLTNSNNQDCSRSINILFLLAHVGKDFATHIGILSESKQVLANSHVQDARLRTVARSGPSSTTFLWRPLISFNAFNLFLPDDETAVRNIMQARLSLIRVCLLIVIPYLPIYSVPQSSFEWISFQRWHLSFSLPTMTRCSLDEASIHFCTRPVSLMLSKYHEILCKRKPCTLIDWKMPVKKYHTVRTSLRRYPRSCTVWTSRRHQASSSEISRCQATPCLLTRQVLLLAISMLSLMSRSSIVSRCLCVRYGYSPRLTIMWQRWHRPSNVHSCQLISYPIEPLEHQKVCNEVNMNHVLSLAIIKVLMFDLQTNTSTAAISANIHHQVLKVH